MYKVLLVESDSDFQKLFSLNLNAYIGAHTVQSQSSEDAILSLDNDEEGIDLIICRYKLGEEIVTQEIVDYLNDSMQIIPVLSMGDMQQEYQGVTAINGNDWKEVIRESAKILEVTSKKMMEHNESLDQFFAIPIENLASVDTEVCDVDVFIYESDNFDQIIEKGEPFPFILIEEMTGSGIELLYVKKNDRLKFINQMTANILMALRDPNISEDKEITLSGVAFDTVRDMLELSGMTDVAIELANESVNSMVKLVNQTDPLFALLEKIKKNTGSYLYQHSVLIAAIAHHIVLKMDWGSQEHANKICFIAMFHDICLENDEQAKINSQIALSRSDLSPRDKKLVEQHALKASMLIKANPKAPYGADSIILQHHGKLNGIGFSNELNSSLSQLAIVFVVAEDYCERIISIEPEFFKRENVMNAMKRKFHKGMYLKVVEALETMGL